MKACSSTGDLARPSAWSATRVSGATPRTVVTGEADTFFPPTKLTAVARRALAIDPVVVPDAGHLLPHEHPQAVIDAILALA